jgi:hypothetical protein
VQDVFVHLELHWNPRICSNFKAFEQILLRRLLDLNLGTHHRLKTPN